MKETHIDCSNIHTREDMHKLFREALAFPEWYGNNLDALYDCLTAFSGKVRLLNWETAEVRLGVCGQKAKKVLAAAARHNTELDLFI